MNVRGIHCDIDALRAALDAGADVNERAWDGMTLLMIAIDSDAYTADDGLPLRVECTALLLARGADTTSRASRDRSTRILPTDARAITPHPADPLQVDCYRTKPSLSRTRNAARTEKTLFGVARKGHCRVFNGDECELGAGSGRRTHPGLDE
jgi:hypothetical protein